MKTEDIYHEISEITFNAIEGNTDALQAYIELNEYEKFIKAEKDKVKELAIDEASKYHEKIIEKSGKKIQLVEKKTWSFDHITSWANLTKQRNELEDKAKASALNNITAFSEDTGEEIEKAIYKTSTFLTIK